MTDRSERRSSDATDGGTASETTSRDAPHDAPRADANPSRARRRLQAQWAVVAALGRALAPAEVTRAVLLAALDGLDADLASIGVLDPAQDGALRVTDAARAPAPGAAAPGAPRIAERTVALSGLEPVAVVARDGRPIFWDSSPSLVPGLADGAALGDAADGDGRHAGAVAAVPLVVGGRAFGALCLRFHAARGFDDDERAFVLAVAQQYAESAERARLVEAEHGARGRAEAASRAKSEFLATMSHEIRTPLNAVVGYTELIELGIAGAVSEQLLAYLARIRVSSKHLLTLVNDMLDLSKVEAGRLVVARSESSAAASIDAAVAIVHAQAAERSIALLASRSADTDVRYCGDPRRVEQILLNLLSNALRFTAPGGRVTVTCRPTDASELPRTTLAPAERWCAIDVVDTGIGIDADHLASIFDPFVQVDMGLTRTYGGSGLGLAISRRLARAMDGDIAVRSAPGDGSTFTLLLPGTEGPLGEGAPASADDGATEAPTLGFADVGEIVLGDVEGIVERYMERLRTDPRTPTAHAMKDTELQDHSAIFVSDIAQALGIAAEAGGRHSTLVRHDHDIQNLIADRHGELRQRMGWSEAELDRDFEILWDEIEQAVRRAAPPGHAAVDEALALLRRFITRASETSHRAYRRMAAASPHAG